MVRWNGPATNLALAAFGVAMFYLASHREPAFNDAGLLDPVSPKRVSVQRLGVKGGYGFQVTTLEFPGRRARSVLLALQEKLVARSVSILYVSSRLGGIHRIWAQAGGEYYVEYRSGDYARRSLPSLTPEPPVDDCTVTIQHGHRDDFADRLGKLLRWSAPQLSE